MTRYLIAMLVPVALVAVAFLPACDSSGDKTDSSSTAPPDYKPPPPAPKPVEAPKPPATPATSAAPATQPANTTVIIDTNMGKIVVALDDDRTPVTVKNFLQYVDDKFYDGTIIHRVEMRNIGVIQGGGYDQNLKEKPTRSPIINEAKKGRSNVRGTIAMARTQAPNSATSQFYINVKDDSMLDTMGAGYCVFGQVVEGMDVVDKISQLRLEDRGGAFATIPAETVIIQSIRRK